MTIEILTVFFGWLSVINIGLLFVVTFFVVVMREFVSSIHTALFGVDQQYLDRAYFQYIATYKIAVIVLNITPYLALKLIA